MAPLVTAEEVRVGYGAREVLRGVSCELAGGELVAVVGPNGAGKTTLARALAGLIAPSGGRVRAFGLDPARAPRRQIARRLAYLPQRYQLAFPFTVGEVVLMGRYARRGAFRLESAADVEAARDAMARCDVAELEHRRFDAISGGEQRRALLAQALCQEAEVLLLDEPTAALDPAHARALFTALRAGCERGAGAMAITHDLNAAVRWADRIIVLDDGRVVAAGAPAEVLASPAAAKAFELDLHVGVLPSGAPFAVPS